ncbi:MAG: hypothetical protein PHU43_07925 [Candidatus Bipolaricaulis sp.]|nr:hypothetical protein [Candidatus Bipolaricaulis sp.]
MQGGKWRRLLAAALVAALFAIPAMAQTFWDDFEDVSYRNGPFDCSGTPLQAGAEAAGWVFEPPWQLVDECMFWGPVPVGVVPFDGTHMQAAYFGYPDPDAGTGDYCDAPADDPTLSSPVITLVPPCDVITVSFDYYRQVESDPGSYDKTLAEVQFYSDAGGTAPLGAPVTIFNMDSSDPSVAAWQTVTDDVSVPAGAVTAQVLFHFDPVDKYNNCFFGWLIDDLTVTCYSTPPVVYCDECPSSLPQGQEGTKYLLNEQTPSESGFDFKTCVYGGYVDPSDPDGIPDWRFSIAKLDPRTGECIAIDSSDPEWPLPERLSLTQDGWLTGNLDSGTAGTYTFWVLVEVGVGRDYSRCCMLLTLAVRSAPGTGSFLEQFDPLTGTWTKCGFETQATPPNLWHTTASLSCSEPSLVNYGTVAYFGSDSTCDYDGTKKRVKGCYCVDVPVDSEQKPGYDIHVGFKSYREVEDYPGGAYDKTYVEVSVDGGATWKPVPALYWDSSTPSTKAWTWQQANTGITTTSANLVSVRFCFDSVDGYGNDFFGWAIDEVTVWMTPAQLVINCCPLPEGFVGEPYEAELGYAGGTCNEEVRVSGLPEGLTPEGTGTTGDPFRIVGTPRTAGTWPVTIEVVSGNEVLDTVVCDLIVNEQVCFFFEDFEADPIWTWGGQWVRVGPLPAMVGVPHGEFSGTPPCDPTTIPVGTDNHVAYYGDPSLMNYDTGARTTGMLSLLDTPAGIDITDCVYIKLTFDSCRRVEQFQDGYDRTKVQIRWDTGPQWYTVWYKDSGDKDPTGWQSEEANYGVPFVVPTGATKMWVRFVFDSVDRWYNNYFGWMIDNIKICCAEDGGPINGGLQGKGLGEGGRDGDAELAVMNVPNPVRDVHTTTFTVRGIGVEAIRIQIFDINETLVFEQEIGGDELVWHTDDNYGDYLANGVYFYRAWAKIDGVWVQTKFQKLVILR